MKRRKLEKALRELGWWFLRHGTRHDIWTNGQIREYVPRHLDISEGTAKAILKTACDNPPDRGTES